MSLTEVVRTNLKHIRDEAGMSQRQAADELTRRTGEVWTQNKISDLEGGRRERTISVEEAVILSRVYGQPVTALFRLPENTLARVGRSLVDSSDLPQLLGLADTAQHFDWQWAWFRDVSLHLFRTGQLTNQLLDQATDGDEEACRQIRDAYLETDPEVFTEIIDDAEFVAEARPRGWGVTYALDDPFVDVVIRTLRKEGDDK